MSASTMQGGHKEADDDISSFPVMRTDQKCVHDVTMLVMLNGTGTFRAQDLSFPRTNSPYGELSFQRLFVPGELSFPKVPGNGTFVPGPFSFSGTFVPGQRKFLGTFVPWTFRSQDFSFPGTFVPPTILQGIGHERRQLYQLSEFVS